MITFEVQIDADEGNVEYARYMLKESMRNWATARVSYLGNISEWQNKIADEIEYNEWIEGRADL